MILNLMFIVFSIPFFTIGAAFSAAYYMGFKMVKNEETYIVKGFWKAFKENFKHKSFHQISMNLILRIRLSAQAGIYLVVIALQLLVCHNFKQATAIWLILVVVFGILIAD